MFEGNHWIAGTATPGDGASFRAIDPTSGETIGPDYPEATVEQVDQAVRRAQQAHRTQRTLPREAWADLLDAIASGLEAAGDPLLERAHRETGLPLARLTGERGRTTAQLRSFAEAVREGSWLEARIDRADPGRTPIPKPDVRSLRRPLGPVVVFGASNFPLAFSVAGGDTASALAAGCPVVVKAHPAHPGTSELVGRVISEAVAQVGMDPGTFSLLHGQGHEVGIALVEHPGVRAVGFTGSLAGGKALFDLAQARPRPIPVFAEMGSTNPVFLLPGAVSEGGDSLADALAGSITLGVGQFCTNPGLLLAVAGPDTEALADGLARRLGTIPEGTLLHPGIRRAYDGGAERLASTPGVRRRTPDDLPSGPCGARPALFECSADTLRAHPQLAEEVFGPSTLLVVADDLADLAELSVRLEGQLTVTIQGTAEDLEAAGSLVDGLEDLAGRVLFGGLPTGVEVCPAMVHGGPYPATTASASTSVGLAAMQRFSRPVCFQDAPQELLPAELRDANPGGILRRVDGAWSRDSLG